ncbi:MAG: ClbS/DfsB family four-helix bundle protein [Chloroflexi bacterium]|nr:ClbS/DfsB family four-helix bundle protein [Chloroflexota bacterium]
METTLEAIIEKIEHSYTQILRLYRSVPITALIEPALANGWSVKDTLAHIAAWEWRCASLLNEAHRTDGPLKAMPDVDALNREFYQERQEWSWAEVETDFRQAHETMLAAIRQLPPERLKSEVVRQTIAEETWEHYAEHLLDLERWHKQVVSRR